MKTIKTTLILSFLAVFSAGAFAQTGNTDNATVTASATVLSDVSITTNSNIDFGNILPDVTATVDPTGSSHTNLLGSPTVGQVTIAGTGTYNVLITVSTTQIDLEETGAGTATIPFTPSYVGHESTQGSATALSNGTNTRALVGGAYIVWVGGSIDATGATGGTYTSTEASSDLTISVQYE